MYFLNVPILPVAGTAKRLQAGRNFAEKGRFLSFFISDTFRIRYPREKNQIGRRKTCGQLFNAFSWYSPPSSSLPERGSTSVVWVEETPWSFGERNLVSHTIYNMNSRCAFFGAFYNSWMSLCGGAHISPNIVTLCWRHEGEKASKVLLGATANFERAHQLLPSNVIREFRYGNGDSQKRAGSIPIPKESQVKFLWAFWELWHEPK